MSQERVYSFAGGRNFRDLGGYATRDGQRLKWGRLFRSGVLSYLTAEDSARADQLGIRTICDLRNRGERLREPTHWGSVDVKRFAWEYEKSRLSLRGLLEGNGFSAPQAHVAMVKIYRQIPGTYSQAYRAVFDSLAANEVPLLFNCSAGKDRTGVLAALILTALGVPHKQVLEDYVLTDSAVDLEKSVFDHPAGSIGLGDEYTFLTQATREDRRPLFISSPAYLHAAFDQIDRDHGSFEHYLQSVLHQSPEALVAIRANLLETP